jgi:hypothetical protein
MRFEARPSRPRPKERFTSDPLYKDVAFIYPVLLDKDSFGSAKEVWAEVPLSVSALIQETGFGFENGLSSELGDPTGDMRNTGRSFHFRTRARDYLKWRDKVVFRGITTQVVTVRERFDNVTNEFDHTEARLLYIEEKGSVNKADFVLPV